MLLSFPLLLHVDRRAEDDSIVPSAKSGPNGPRICIVAVRPVVIVALVAFLAASMSRLWLGANSLARNAPGDTGSIRLLS